jgi:CRISPR-associated protein Csb2
MDTHAQALVIQVRSVTRRYHGATDYPPSPFRLYQALIAGAYGGRWAAEPSSEKDAAFSWLESLGPPHVAGPRRVELDPVTYFVPNNDLDSVGGDPRRVAEIRSQKTVRTKLLTSDAPFIYAWRFQDGLEHAELISHLADRLHTLGHGIDAAFATAHVLSWSAAEQVLSSSELIARPSGPGDGVNDPTCPTPGSLESLKVREQARATRFDTRSGATIFRQPPKPILRTVAYGRHPTRLLFELRPQDFERPFRSVPLEHAARLVRTARDVAGARLKAALPEKEKEIELYVIQRPIDAFTVRRQVRFLPIPSIGHEHVDSSIRRMVVEVPPECPIESGEISWALAGQLVEGGLLVPAEDDSMLQHYGFGARARRWHTITPVSFAADLARGRLTGGQRMAEEERVAKAVAVALSEWDRPASGVEVRVQREPFWKKGLRADAFSPSRRCRHVEVVFGEPIEGPLFLGDGVFDGLGLFAPADELHRRRRSSLDLSQSSRGQTALFQIDGPPVERTVEVAHLARGALMSLAGNPVPSELSGRNERGPLRAEAEHAHAFYLPVDDDGDGLIDHLLVHCWGVFSRKSLDAFDRVSRLWGFGRDPRSNEGRPDWPLRLLHVGDAAEFLETSLPTFSSEWISCTPYFKPRYDKKAPVDFASRIETYRVQIVREWRLRRPQAPIPRVEPIAENDRFVLSNGLEPTAFDRDRQDRGGAAIDRRGGFFRLVFPRAVCGPISLGKHAHFGLGLFKPDIMSDRDRSRAR